jgi:hypothetical protein
MIFLPGSWDLHDRQVCRFLALEDSPCIDAGLSIRLDEAGAIAH